MEVSAIVQEWKDRLAQHCCICNNWALNKSSVKCHLIRMHAQEWYRVAEQVTAACKAHKHHFARNEECSLCHKQVYGVERHALQCPVLFQACFMSCLLSTPAVVPNIWQGLKCLTREASIAHLEGMQPVAQEVSEPLTLFCVLCARKDMEAPIVDVQAWRRYFQQVHGVAKAILNEQFHEHAALVPISRPCPFCAYLSRSLPSCTEPSAFPLLSSSVKQGYAGISGEPDRGSGGACFTNDGNAQLHPTGSQGQQRDGEACQISEAGEGRGQRPAVRAKAPRASRRRGDGGPGPGLENRAENHPHSAGEARSGAQLSGGKRTYVLFFSTTEMSTLAMLRTVTNHWREQYEQGKCTNTVRATLLTSLWMEMGARLTKFEKDAAAMKVMMDQGLFLDAPHRLAYTAWSQQEKKGLVTDQPHLSSDELKAAIKTLKAAAMTEGIIHKFAPMQKLGENISVQTVVFTLVLTTRPKVERIHTEMAEKVNSSLIGLRLRPERIQLSPLAKPLAGMK